MFQIFIKLILLFLIMSLNEVLIFHAAINSPQVLSKSLQELNLSSINEQADRDNDNTHKDHE
jgi:hypothetical protein